jgi:REP element-mobilizing transposase RayT
LENFSLAAPFLHSLGFPLVKPPRLTRLDRIHLRAPIYFLTTNTAGRHPLLDHPSVHEALVHFALRGSEHGAWLGRYVLMPDHCHLFLACDDERITLSAWMKSFKNTLSKALRALGFPSPHWQKGFFDHLLRSHESAAEKWEYVRQNPVRAGLVARAEDWPYAGEIFPLEYRSEQL